MEYPMKNFLKVLPVFVVLLLVSNPAFAADTASSGDAGGYRGFGAG